MRFQCAELFPLSSLDLIYVFHASLLLLLHFNSCTVKLMIVAAQRRLRQSFCKYRMRYAIGECILHVGSIQHMEQRVGARRA